YQRDGLDLVAALAINIPSIIITPGGRAAIPTGLAFALPPEVEGQIRPRSGLALHYGVTVLNAPSTIDRHYHGEVHVILANFGNDPFEVKRGMPSALLVLVPTVQASIQEVSSFEGPHRGFGSL